MRESRLGRKARVVDSGSETGLFQHPRYPGGSLPKIQLREKRCADHFMMWPGRQGVKNGVYSYFRWTWAWIGRGIKKNGSNNNQNVLVESRFTHTKHAQGLVFATHDSAEVL